MSKTVTIEFNRPFPPGMNGSKGLIRMHYHTKKKEMKRVMYLIRLQTNTRFKGAVSVKMHLDTCHPIDWDNYSSMFKLIGDSLVSLNIIEDDNPNIIKDFIPTQRKVSTKKQEVLRITITEIK